MPRTALIIEVPEAEPSIGALRLEHDPSAAQGVGAHITILFPFADPVDEDAVAELFLRFRPFDFTLDRVERFEEGQVWLRPTPAVPFVDLTAAVVQRWPDYPPYEGMHDEIIPHVTISVSPIDVDVQLPIAAHAHEVTLIVQGEHGRWSVQRRFPLGSGVAAHAVE
jgi:2'-5' RNA ligase superfamily protein